MSSGPCTQGDPSVDADRYQVLRDQLEIYERHGASWSIWTYKDIGLQGLVYADPDSPWMRRIRPVLEKKARLGVDHWGSLDTKIRHVLQPLEELLAKEFPTYQPFPYMEPSPLGQRWIIHRLVRHILLAEAMVGDFGRQFRGVTEQEALELAESFLFERCIRRTSLEEVLKSVAIGTAC